MRLRRVANGIALGLVLGAPADGEDRAPASALLSAEDLGSLRAGGVVAKVVDTDDRAEVMSVAAFRAPVDVRRFLECARSARGFGRAEDSLGEGRIGKSPTAADFAGLRLDDRDVGYLSRCRPGDCKVRLTADAIARIGREVDWSAKDRAKMAEAAFREMCVREASSYEAEGHPGLADYADGPNSRKRAQGLAQLLGRPLYLLEGAPGLQEYLRAFPSGRPPLVDEFLAWRKDRFWRKPVVGLFHVVISETTDARERRILVVTKQLYASHYLESGIELVDLRQGAADPAADVTLVSRVRADIRPSGFNWLERLLLRRLVRGRLEDQFESLRARLARPRGAASRPEPPDDDPSVRTGRPDEP